MIGDDVTITVLGVKGNQTRLGVTAPKEVAVHREEIFNRIKSEQADGELICPEAVGVDHQLALIIFGECGESAGCLIVAIPCLNRQILVLNVS